MNQSEFSSSRNVFVACIVLGLVLAGRGQTPPSGDPSPSRGETSSLGQNDSAVQSTATISSLPVRGKIETAGYPAKIYKAPDRTSSVIGFVLRGDRYPLLIEGTGWYGIAFRDMMGWVDPQSVRTVDKTNAEEPRQEIPESTSTTPAPAGDTLRRQTPSPVEAPNSRSRARRESARLSLSVEILKRMPTLKILADNLSELEEDTTTTMVRDTVRGPTGYIQIIAANAPIFAEVKPNAPTVGVARQGEHYPLLMEGTNWSSIKFGDTMGWVERRLTETWTPTRLSRLIENVPIYSFFVLGGLLVALLGTVAAILIGGIALVKRVTRTSTPGQTGGRSCLIIARAAKSIESGFSERHISLETCFSEASFEVNMATDPIVARSILSHHTPDVVCVDWEFGPNIQVAVEQVLAARGGTMVPAVIFYNVPDPRGVRRTTALAQAYYLGASFSDRDVFKAVMSAAEASSGTTLVRASTESHALEGEITDGSISEVLQFIEMGSKDGCLLVEVGGNPYGMVAFEQGIVVYAVARDLPASEAPYQILGLTSGKFRFIADKPAPAHNMSMGTLELIMEWTRRHDEATRG